MQRVKTLGIYIRLVREQKETGLQGASFVYLSVAKRLGPKVRCGTRHTLSTCNSNELRSVSIPSIPIQGECILYTTPVATSEQNTS